jgi:hypothetical protein
MKTAILLLVALAGCATAAQYTQWPYRGPMMMVRNPTSSLLVVMARDGTGRELVAARIKPNSKQCFRWPFIHAIGYLVSADTRADTVTTEPFKPWSADGWEWSGGVEPVSNPKVCR